MAESSVVDFTPLRVRPWEGIMDPIAAAYQHALDQKQKREEQDKTLAFQREQEARRTAEDKARQATTDRRLLGQQTLQTAQERAKVDAAIRQAAGVPGNLNEAKRLAQSYVELDPETNTVIHGRPFSSEAPGPEPVAPMNPGPAEEGPRIGQDDLENAAVIRAQQEAPPPTTDDAGGIQVNAGGTLGKYNEMKQEAARFGRTQDDAAQYEKDKGAFGLQQASYEERARNPRLNIGGVETTPDEIRYTGARAGAEDFKGMSAPLQQGLRQAMETGDPQTISQAQRKVQVYAELLPQVEKGLITPAQASARIGSAGTIEETLAGKLGAQREHDVTSGEYGLERQRIANQKPQAPGQGQRLDFNEKKEKSANLRKDVKTTVNERFNAKTTQEAAQEFPNIVKMLDSGNGKLQEQALITMMRLAQKDNRFSDADAKMAMRTGAGWLDQAESWFSRGATGEIGPGVIQHAAEAAKRLNGFYQQKQHALNEAAQSFLEQPEYYDPKEAEQLLRRELPGFVPRGQKPQTAPGAPARKSVQDLIREAGGQ